MKPAPAVDPPGASGFGMLSAEAPGAGTRRVLSPDSPTRPRVASGFIERVASGFSRKITSGPELPPEDGSHEKGGSYEEG
jgi:hypothetical protein